MNAVALVGGQFGSEGKGLIAGYIATHFGHHVRVGAANAGHTVWVETGTEDSPEQQKHVMQQVPCAAYANPAAELYIGPGAQISDDIFRTELGALDTWRAERDLPPIQVQVDHRAHVIQPEHIEREQQSGLAKRIGSTSTIAKEGIGAAQAARVMRDETCVQALDWFEKNPCAYIEICDVPERLDKVKSILLEGTQGTGLSLTTGPFPYATSRNTTAAGLCADTGVPPSRIDDTIVVFRTFPIRVAGNSGPFGPGSEEIEWSDIDVLADNERTTVTRKIRRVATFSIDQAVEAVRLNGGTIGALTFCDYLDPSCARDEGGITMSRLADSYPLVAERVALIELATGMRIRFLGTGPANVMEIVDE